VMPRNVPPRSTTRTAMMVRADRIFTSRRMTGGEAGQEPFR
jgi:hypothetical protein